MEGLPDLLLSFILESLAPAAAQTVVRENFRVQAESCVNRYCCANAIMALVSSLLLRTVKHNGYLSSFHLFCCHLPGQFQVYSGSFCCGEVHFFCDPSEGLVVHGLRQTKEYTKP
uniref:Putative secreted protein n=1 Tax=Ixodes ricinus TaxID=34613 RepID=A0A147BBG2_IXORI